MADIKEKYQKFFSNRELVSRFEKVYSGQTVPEEAMISVLCGLSTNSFPAAVGRMVGGRLEDGEQYLDLIESYGLRDEFWKLCDTHFAFRDQDPDLQKLIVSIFVTDFR